MILNRRMNRQPLLFVHIPKTAGTSFRKAVERCVSPACVAYDYGKKSGDTSEVILDAVYDKKDAFLLDQGLQSGELQFVCGHFPASKYLSLFGCTQTLTFLREPVERLVSEYHHLVNHYGYPGDFKSFYSTELMINRQSRMLRGLPLPALGFAGVTEAYDDGLKIFRARYGLETPQLKLNPKVDKGAKSTRNLEKSFEEIRALNDRDIALYKWGKRLHQDRVEQLEGGLPYVHGMIQNLSRRHWRGWAWWEQSSDPVVVQVVRDGEVLDETTATEIRPGLAAIGSPRAGNVGFTLTLPKAAAGKGARCVVKETGQEIRPSPEL